MRTVTVLIFGLLVSLAGCGGGRNPAYQTPYIDKEFGTASRESLARQVVYPEGRNSAKTVEGMDGINAEPAIRKVYQSYAEKPKKDLVIKMGIEK